ncbi:MAG: prolipoprotein diacylglyceryl transferase [Oscillospiraceae bacterium]|nr:prolipoprotein diacylglyceryl transferase [Oscillospiraceae bacterium]
MSKTITFPGLGWEFTVNPVLLSITDSFGIHWYGAIIAAGFLLAVVWCCRQCRNFGIQQDHLIDMLYFALPIGIIGARLYYVAFEFRSTYYVQGDPLATLIKIVRIWDGGLAIYGGILFAVLTALVYCRVRHLPFLTIADISAMGLLIGQCIGRWGNFVNVEAFGSVTDVPWRMAGPNVASYLLNTGQVDADTAQAIIDGTLGVHPTFFYESVWNFIGFLLIALLLRPRRRFDGQMFFSYIAWYGLGRLWIEGLRTDSLYIPGTALRVSQLLALLSALAALGWLVYMYLVKKPGPEQLYINRIRQPEELAGEETKNKEQECDSNGSHS